MGRCMRVWAAERLADEMGASNIAGAPWVAPLRPPSEARSAGMSTCTRYLPSPGCSRLATSVPSSPRWTSAGTGSAADVLHLGHVAVDEGARVGARSMLCPGASVRARAEPRPGSAVFGEVPAGEAWGGAPLDGPAVPAVPGATPGRTTARHGWWRMPRWQY